MIKKGLFLLCFILLCFGMPVPAQAEERTETLMTLEEQENIIVTLFYDREEPSVRFLSPSRQEYSESLGNLRVVRESGALFCYLPDAEAGSWLIGYDQKSNTEFMIDYNEYTESIVISHFTMQESGENQLQAEFQADFPSEIVYQYSLSAVVTDETGMVTGNRELETGSAVAGQRVERRVSLDRLSAYDQYHLQLNVWYKEYSLETWDYRIAEETFAAAGGNELDPMTGADVLVDMEDQTVLIDWEKYKVYCDHYLVAVRTGKEIGDTPHFFQTVNDRTSVKAGIPSDCEQITVELTYFGHDGRASLPYRRQIYLDAAECNVTTEENTASGQAEITYQTEQTISAEVRVNEEMQTLQLSGEGAFSVHLNENRNEIEMSCRLDEMTTVVYRWDIYSDRIPPLLKLYEDIDGITVNAETFLLTGEMEGGSILTINGDQAELSESGMFQMELQLEQGENAVVLEAEDLVGNKTVMNAVVFRGTPEDAEAFASRTAQASLSARLENWLPLFFAILFGILGVLTVIATISIEEKRRKDGDGTKRGMMTMLVFRNLLFFGAFAAAIIAAWFMVSALELQRLAESAQFLNAAQSSVTEAYDLLQEQTQYRQLGIAAAVIAVVFVIWGILMGILRRILQKAAKNIS